MDNLWIFRADNLTPTPNPLTRIIQGTKLGGNSNGKDGTVITHLHPDCNCNHKPGHPCNASCKVHGIPEGADAGLFYWTGNAWVRWDGAA